MNRAYECMHRWMNAKLLCLWEMCMHLVYSREFHSDITGLHMAGLFLTSLDVTFSRSCSIMMLLSLVLMRHSVRSLSVGLERAPDEDYTPRSAFGLGHAKSLASKFQARASSLLSSVWNVGVEHVKETRHSLTCCTQAFRTTCEKEGDEAGRTHLSPNMAGESGRSVSRSCMAFHSLMQLCSDEMQLS